MGMCFERKTVIRWRLGTCEASRFDSNSNRPSNSIRFKSDGLIRKFSNRIGRACPLLVVGPVQRGHTYSCVPSSINVVARLADNIPVECGPTVERHRMARMVFSSPSSDVARPAAASVERGHTCGVLPWPRRTYSDLIRDSIRIRILTPDSIRDSIRMQTADSQVPSEDMYGVWSGRCQAKRLTKQNVDRDCAERLSGTDIEQGGCQRSQ